MNIRQVTLLGMALLGLQSCGPERDATSLDASEKAAVQAYQAWVLLQVREMVVKAEDLSQAMASAEGDKARRLSALLRTDLERIGPAWTEGDQAPRVRDALRRLDEGDRAAKDLKIELQALEDRLGGWTTSGPELVAASVTLARSALVPEFRLTDVQGRVEGAEQIWQLLSPSVRTSDPELAKTLDARFSLLYGLLEVQRKNGVFRPSQDVYPKEVEALRKAARDLEQALERLAKAFPPK